MEPENIRFGGGVAATVLHPIVAIAMVITIVLMFTLRRKYVIVPALLAIFLIPKGQQLVVAGMHFNMFRILILAGLARWIVSRRSAPLPGGFTFMDRIVTAFFVCSFGANIFLYNLQTQAIIKDTGDLLDALGCYFVLRFLIQDRDDIRRTIKVLATIAMINAVDMVYEQFTGANLLDPLGGVPVEVWRDGKLRSQGTFEIFLTAGAFGATLPPLLVWLWTDTKSKFFGVLGFLSATVMAVTCFASTTLVGYAAGFMGLGFWLVRKRMRLIRWGIVIALIGLHLVMHGPVWSIIEHLDLTGSSSSYHRYMLIDNFVRHFGDWWLVGTRDNGSWGYDMWDTSNQYVFYAFAGGLIGFSLFVGIISRAFSKLGKARKYVEGNRKEEWFVWCLGSALYAHVISFFGLNYMDQMEFAWLALLVIICVGVLETTSAAVPVVQEEPMPDWDIQPVNS
jgi:hypothetical protein